jgi:hypothetical protein
MNDPAQPEPAKPSDLQFDHAEYQTPAASAVTCTLCQQEVPDQYYEINGKVICPTCRTALEARFTGGSRLGRFLRAGLFGSIAAALGSGIYYGVVKLTNYHLSLISILVGWMVGSAVRRGAHYRGGLVYQLMAVFLTYTSIVSTYIPEIVAAFADAGKQEVADAPPVPAAPKLRDAVEPKPNEAAEPNPKAAVDPKPEAVGEPKQEAAAEVIKAPVAPDAGREPKQMNDPPPAILILVVAFVAPFLAIRKNFLLLVIIFFALQQAWRLNRKPQITINGPYRVGEAGAQVHEVGEPPIEGAAADA